MFPFRTWKTEFFCEGKKVQVEYNKILDDKMFLIITVLDVEEYCGG